MTPRSDPYRVLGLVPGATPGEIRSAYRRLAKMHHPDTAGERSLGRFLAIKAAYEELLDGEGRLRTRGWPTTGGSSTPTRPGNPSARGASRDAWRARQGSGASGAKTGTGGKTGTGPTAAGADEGDGETEAGPGTADEAPASPGTKRGGTGAKRGARTDGAKSGGGSTRGTRGKSGERRTAKPGSTTYDEASLGLDPSWDGAGWYGASSGSYWTLNPREYADPRKHGPEYQERARRAAKLEAQLRARRAAEAAAASGSSGSPGSGSGASSDSSSAPPTEMPPASSATVEPDADPRERGS